MGDAIGMEHDIEEGPVGNATAREWPGGDAIDSEEDPGGDTTDTEGQGGE